jgi:hypothetical protein
MIRIASGREDKVLFICVMQELTLLSWLLYVGRLMLRHGRDVHPAWVNVVTAALALKSFGGQVTRAEVMLESREGSGF